MQNTDTCFKRFVKNFKMEIPIVASIGVQQGFHGELGWGVYICIKRNGDAYLEEYPTIRKEMHRAGWLLLGRSNSSRIQE
jgi:hypothetical protein